MSEKATYTELIAKKIAQGLKDVKFFAGNTFNASEESIYGELNRMHEASDLPDPEVLGRFSPGN